MTYFLPMSVTPGARSHRPIQMQFAAPILTAEAYGFDAAPVALCRTGVGEGEGGAKLALPSGAVAAVALGLGLMIWTGAIYWVLA
ncbi:hypothetical protein C8J30_11382 [Rhodobacter viridis]|uniref:Uncharacterized protein n=1 Tax=Rhodobacter viridis TaxID=1054202 RepID=A0A318TV64_9RHOB|nr:hypothetical protein [Rhodobacter viridis]PYF08223.1 hypothetical protein C8J30_11382 [Rhodobacter viridis]